MGIQLATGTHEMQEVPGQAKAGDREFVCPHDTSAAHSSPAPPGSKRGNLAPQTLPSNMVA